MRRSGGEERRTKNVGPTGVTLSRIFRMRRSYLIVTAVCVGWGTIPLVVRHVDLPAAAIVAVRLWVAAAGLGIALLMSRGRGEPRPRLLSVHPRLCVAAALV